MLPGDDIRISLHAIDRASTRLLELYLEERAEEEGIVTWLEAIVREAIQLDPVERHENGADVYELGKVRIVVRGDTVVTITEARPADHPRRMQRRRWVRALEGLSAALRRDR